MRSSFCIFWVISTLYFMKKIDGEKKIAQKGRKLRLRIDMKIKQDETT